MAGHKGYGLAVLVEILTAVMTGSAMMSQVQSWASDLPDPSNQGHAFIAMDVSSMMPAAEFTGRMDHMSQELKSAPTAEGTDRIYLPGEMEWERRDKALVDGMELPEDVLISLRGLAEDLEIDPSDYNLNLGG